MIDMIQPPFDVDRIEQARRREQNGAYDRREVTRQITPLIQKLLKLEDAMANKTEESGEQRLL